jgi:cyclase
VFLDITASHEGRATMLDVVRRTAEGIYMPLTVGGGIRLLEDIRTLLRAGADKVSLNTAAIRRPELVREASRRFGSSTIMVSIEAIRRADGVYEAYTDNGREKTGLEAVAWAVRAAELGAGELMVTSIDREGTGRGYDLELTRRIAEAVPVPVIACGGAGSVEDVAEVLRAGAAAASLASVLHYDLIRRFTAESHEFAPEINLAHLQRPGFAKIQDASLADLKTALAGQGIASRPLVAHA